MITLEKLTDEVKNDEGFVARPYHCSAGFQTIGYGWNLESTPISEKAATAILQEQLIDCIEQCANLPWFGPLSDARQRVIVNMTFNLGFAGMLKFKNMIEAIQYGNFNDAAAEMLDSRWARQVGARADRLAEMMREG